MEHRGAFVVPQANGHHFCQAALIAPLEIRVGFDFVQKHQPIRLGSQAVAIHGGPVIQNAQLHDLHAR